MASKRNRAGNNLTVYIMVGEHKKQASSTFAKWGVYLTVIWDMWSMQ